MDPLLGYILYFLTGMVVVWFVYKKLVVRHKFGHSQYCPDFDSHWSMTSGRLSDEEKESIIPNAFEWMSRLNNADRIKCWRYLNTPDVFRFMQNLTGSNWILYLAALRTKYGLFACSDVTLSYSSIKVHETEWCKNYFEEQEARLLHGPIDALTSRDLDRCWCLFYATGDLAFADRVKQVGNQDVGTSVERAAVIGAARWSYQSHLQSGRLQPTPGAQTLAIINAIPIQ